MVTVPPEDPRWHDKGFSEPREFTCKHCGSSGRTVEADALCDECNMITCLEIEIIYP